MRKFVPQGLLLFCLSLTGFFLSRSQTIVPSYQALLAQFNEAQKDYNRATQLSRQQNSGPKVEAAEDAFNRSALNAFQKLYSQIPAKPAFDSLRFYTAFKVGELHHYFEDYASAVSFYLAALSTRGSKHLSDSVYFKPYLYAGIIYYTQNKFDSALSFFQLAEGLQKKFSNQLQEGERLYNIVGVLFYERGNYRQARNYFQKALEVLHPRNEAYENLYVNYNINLAQISLKLEEYERADSIYRRLLPLHIMTNEINHNIGSLNLAVGAADSALSYFRKIGADYNKTVRLFNNMGNAFLNKHQFDSAWWYYQKAVSVAKARGKENDPVGYGLTLKSMGDYALQLDKPEEAIANYQQAIRQFYPFFFEADVRKNPVTYSGVFSYINLFNTLLAKAEAWHQLYQKKGQLTAGEYEVETYQSAFQLIDYVERSYESDEARLFLSKIKYTLHSKPVEIAFELYRRTGNKKFLEELYRFDQQNKATALVLSRQANEYLAASHSPLLQKEEALKAAITLASIRASQLSDSGQLARLNQQIRDNEIQLSKVQEEVNQTGSVRENGIPSIGNLQTGVLDQSTALLSYQLSDDKLTALVVTKDSAYCWQKSLPENFRNDFIATLSELKNPESRRWQEVASLYSTLFLGGTSLRGLNKLIIVPDDVLNYFPFEILQEKDGRYLVEDFSLLYQYSTALLKKEKNRLAGAAVLSFAPFSKRSSDGFSVLPGSYDEIAGLRGRMFSDSAATKSRFLQNCSAYPVLHLATHAVVNNQQENLSFIAFSSEEKDHLLYAQEIYNLPLKNTSLVLLSACETASGQLVRGEGVMSLSRAFRYAGCPNVVTTLWKANDYSTAYLTKRIHEALRKGIPIAEAVQAAKKAYLSDKTIHPRLKLPAYWSHLIFIGNIQEPRPFPWFWFSGAALLLAILFLFLRRKSRKRDLRTE